MHNYVFGFDRNPIFCIFRNHPQIMMLYLNLHIEDSFDYVVLAVPLLFWNNPRRTISVIWARQVINYFSLGLFNALEFQCSEVFSSVEIINFFVIRELIMLL
jgi:hypothetical protein